MKTKQKTTRRFVQSETTKHGRDIREAIRISESLIQEQRSCGNESRYKHMICELQTDIAKIQERMETIHEKHSAAPARLKTLEGHLEKLKSDLVQHQCRRQIERIRRLQQQLMGQTSVN